MIRRTAVSLILLLAAGCSSSRLDNEAYVSTSGDASTAEGVVRRFTICYNPLTQDDWRHQVDRLVFAQCGRYVEPLAERTAACTLANPNSQTFSCLLPPE